VGFPVAVTSVSQLNFSLPTPMELDDSSHGLDVSVVGLDGETFTLRVMESKTGRDLRDLIVGRIPSKAGACISLLHQSQKLSMNKTLREQGLTQESASLSYVYLPVNLIGTWALIKGLPFYEDESVLEGVTQLKGIKAYHQLQVLPTTLQSLTLDDSFSDNLASVSFPSTLRSLRFGHAFNERLDGVVLPSSLETLTFGSFFDQSLEHVKFPKHLHSLSFGLAFNHSLARVKLPSELKTLVFGREFNRRLEKVKNPTFILGSSI